MYKKSGLFFFLDTVTLVQGQILSIMNVIIVKIVFQKE